MALTALTQRTMPFGSRSIYIVGILGIFGTSLFLAMGSLLRRSRCCQQLKVWKWLSLI